MSVFLKTSVLKLLESNLRTAKEIRCYARWTHRRPRRVLTSEEYDELEAKHKQKHIVKLQPGQNTEEKIIDLSPAVDVAPLQVKSENPLKHRWGPQNLQRNLGLVNMQELDQKSDVVNYKVEPKLGKKKKASYKIAKTAANSKSTTDMLETVIDDSGNFIYTKLQNSDPVVGQLLVTVKSRKEQLKQDLALLEGKRLIKDALEAQCTLKSLIFSRKGDIEFLKPYLPKSGAKLYKMPYREIQMWSDLTTTPGVMGIFQSPKVENFEPEDYLPLTVICDNIREPGNLGAVLRAAAGVGAQAVILTKGCVDLWDTKVLRSACGAHFRLQIHKKMDWPEIKKRLATLNSTVFIADNRIVSGIQDEASAEPQQSLKDLVISMPLLPYYGAQFRDFSSIALIVGGETEGISEESYRLATDYNGIRLNIPLNNNVESLNTGTALGIIMFEIKRQLLLSSYRNEAQLSAE